MDIWDGLLERYVDGLMSEENLTGWDQYILTGQNALSVTTPGNVLNGNMLVESLKRPSEQG